MGGTALGRLIEPSSVNGVDQVWQRNGGHRTICLEGGSVGDQLSVASGQLGQHGVEAGRGHTVVSAPVIVSGEVVVAVFMADDLQTEE